MAITLQPVFKDTDKPAPPTPEEAQRQDDALSRQAYLGGLAQDREFAAHVLDGWLAEQEAEALARMGSCRADELVDSRARWQAIKDLRQGLAATIPAHAEAARSTSSATGRGREVEDPALSRIKSRMTRQAEGA